MQLPEGLEDSPFIFINRESVASIRNSNPELNLLQALNIPTYLMTPTIL